MRDIVSTLPDLVVPQQYREVIERIAAVAADLARTHRRRRRTLHGGVGENADGDRQTALDLIADEAFRTALTGAGRALLRLRGAGLGGRARPGRRRSRWRSIRSTARRTSRSTCRSARSSRSTRPRRRRRRASCGRGASWPARATSSTGRAAASSPASATGCRSPPARPGERAVPAGGRRRDAAAEVGGVRDQRIELPALGPGDPRLCRRLRRRHRGAARAGLQHALDRLAGRRGAPDPDARRHLPLPARRAEGLRARAAAAGSTNARRSPS